MTESPHEVHNRAVAPIVKSIIMPTLEAGGDAVEVLVLLESVCASVLTFVVKLGGDEDILDLFAVGLRERMANVRLGDIEPRGRG